MVACPGEAGCILAAMSSSRSPRTGLAGIPALLRENEMLLTLATMMVTIMFGFGMVVPVIPLYGRTFGVSATMVGLLVTSFGVARLVSNLPAGRLADRIGRRPLIIAGPLISATGASLAFLAPGFWSLAGALLIQGVGSACYATAAMTTLVDISTTENRGRMMSIHQGSLLIGASFGPSVGGIIGGTFELRTVFAISAVLYVLVAVWAMIRVRETLAPERGGSRSRGQEAGEQGSTLSLLLHTSFLAVAFVSMVIFFTRTGSRSTMIPLIGADTLDLSPGMIGAVLTVAAVFNVLVLPFAGWGIDHFGRKRMIVPSTFVSGCGLLMFAFAPNLTVFFIAAAVLGTGTGIAGPAPAAYVADLARGRNYGSTLGLFRSVSDLGFVLGPIALGFIADQRTFSTALVANATLLFVACGVFALFAREVRHEARSVVVTADQRDGATDTTDARQRSTTSD
jgi:MFS transporter, DHA1 family, multidrug resistance protein